MARKYTSDLDASEFISEIESFKYQADSMMNNVKEATPLEILQFVHSCALTDAYPNIEIAIRMFLAIPVRVASCERSFSKLKLIKNYLRSTMDNGRLSNLLTILIDYRLANTLNYDELIDNFAALKARKVDL